MSTAGVKGCAGRRSVFARKYAVLGEEIENTQCQEERLIGQGLTEKETGSHNHVFALLTYYSRVVISRNAG